MWFFNKKKAKKNPKFTKVFYATDVHGSEPTFGKFINAANFYDVDVIILGGDITGKLLIPIIKEDGNYRATIMDVLHTAKNEQDLKTITKLIEHLGCYHAHMSADEFSRLKENPADVDLLFKQKAHERLTKWLKKADLKFQDQRAKCYITGGNDDDLVVGLEVQVVVGIVEVGCAQDGRKGVRPGVVGVEGRVWPISDLGQLSRNINHSALPSRSRSRCRR